MFFSKENREKERIYYKIYLIKKEKRLIKNIERGISIWKERNIFLKNLEIYPQ